MTQIYNLPKVEAAPYETDAAQVYQALSYSGDTPLTRGELAGVSYAPALLEQVTRRAENGELDPPLAGRKPAQYILDELLPGEAGELRIDRATK